MREEVFLKHIDIESKLLYSSPWQHSMPFQVAFLKKNTLKNMGRGQMDNTVTFSINRNNSIKIALVAVLLYSFSSGIMAQPETVQAESVQNCRYLDQVEGNSGYGKKYEWQSLAKYLALKQAEKMGASHVVWERFHNIGAFNGIVIGKAYQCNS